MPEVKEILPAGNSFGERLRWTRKRAGLSLESFGISIGFNQGYLSKLERGIAQNPSADFTRKVSAIYRVSLEWLEQGTGTPELIPDREGNYSPIGKELAEQTEFHIALALFLETMDWQQILRCLRQVIDHPTMSPSAKVFWAKILSPWSDVKMRRAEKEGRLIMQEWESAEGLDSEYPKADAK